MNPSASCQREKPASKGYSLYDSIYMTSYKGKTRGTGNRRGCKELRVGGGLTRKRQQEEIGRLMDILHTWMVVVVTRLDVRQSPQNCMLKQVNFTACQLYLKYNGEQISGLELSAGLLFCDLCPALQKNQNGCPPRSRRVASTDPMGWSMG